MWNRRRSLRVPLTTVAEQRANPQGDYWEGPRGNTTFEGKNTNGIREKVCLRASTRACTCNHMTEGLITRSINVAGDQSTRRNRGKNCTFVHFSKLNHILPIFLRTHPKLTAVKQHRLQSCQDSRPDLSEAMSVFLLIFSSLPHCSLVISGISRSNTSCRLSEKTGFEIGEMG